MEAIFEDMWVPGGSEWKRRGEIGQKFVLSAGYRPRGYRSNQSHSLSLTQSDFVDRDAAWSSSSLPPPSGQTITKRAHSVSALADRVRDSSIRNPRALL